MYLEKNDKKTYNIFREKLVKTRSKQSRMEQNNEIKLYLFREK